MPVVFKYFSLSRGLFLWNDILDGTAIYIARESPAPREEGGGPLAELSPRPASHLHFRPLTSDAFLAQFESH